MRYNGFNKTVQVALKSAHCQYGCYANHGQPSDIQTEFSHFERNFHILTFSTIIREMFE